MADAFVRAARPEDVAEIARIQLDTWRTAYRRLVPAEVLDALTPELAEAGWGAAVAAPPTPAHRVLVATEGRWTVGFVAFGPGDDDTESAGGTIETLLVEPRWGRRGHGSRLLAAATDLLRRDGMTSASVWLLDGDRPSREFYTSAGWDFDGTGRTLDAGGRELRERRLHAELPPA